MLNPPSAPSPLSLISIKSTPSDLECGNGCMTSSQRMMKMPSMAPSTVLTMSPGRINRRPRPSETGLPGESAWGYHGKPHSNARIPRRENDFAPLSLVLLNGEHYLTPESHL
jgi:hypothetical protein